MPVRLDRWALHGAERAEHAAVAATGSQNQLAVAALIVELALIRGHCFLFGKTAMRAGQHGLKTDILQSPSEACLILIGPLTTATDRTEPGVRL